MKPIESENLTDVVKSDSVVNNDNATEASIKTQTPGSLELLHPVTGHKTSE